MPFGSIVISTLNPSHVYIYIDVNTFEWALLGDTKIEEPIFESMELQGTVRKPYDSEKIVITF